MKHLYGDALSMLCISLNIKMRIWGLLKWPQTSQKQQTDGNNPDTFQMFKKQMWSNLEIVIPLASWTWTLLFFAFFFFPGIFVHCIVFDSKLFAMIAKVKSKMDPMIKMPALCKAELAGK